VTHPNDNPFICIHYNMVSKTWVVMSAPDAQGPLKWTPVYDHINHDVAAAYALKLVKAHKARLAPLVPSVVFCEEGGAS
jgi:hypothetical protein